MKKLKVIHCAETIKGGIATYLNSIIPELEENSINTFTIVPKSQVQELNYSTTDKNTFTFEDGKNRILNSISLWKKVKQLIIKNNPDILHIHSSIAGATVRFLARKYFPGLKLVYCSHGWAWDRETTSLKKYIYKKTETLLSTYCDVIICISEYEYKSAISAGIDKRKLKVVLNGIKNPNIDKKRLDFKQKKHKKLQLLFVGRFDHQKGVDIFIELMNLLGEKAQATMIGDKVLNDTNELTLPSNTICTGWLTQSELSKYYLDADLLIMPSRWEGFGLVAAEALAHGLPVMSSCAGGLPEIVSHGKTGFLIQTNSSTDYKIQLDKISRECLENMRVNCIERYEQLFSSHRLSCEIKNIYMNV